MTTETLTKEQIIEFVKHKYGVEPTDIIRAKLSRDFDWEGKREHQEWTSIYCNNYRICVRVIRKEVNYLFKKFNDSKPFISGIKTNKHAIMANLHYFDKKHNGTATFEIIEKIL